MEEFVDKLRDILLNEDYYNPADGILELAERISSKGQSVEVSSYALSNPKCELEKKTRVEIFENAVQALIGKTSCY